MPTIKCAIVIDPSLPPGVIANTAAVLALSVGRSFPHLVGADLRDSRGAMHHGITTIALPILGAPGDQIRAIRETLAAPASGFGELGELGEITVIDLIGATRTTRSYADYAQALHATPAEQLDYLGIALCGPARQVNRLTGSLGLLR